MKNIDEWYRNLDFCRTNILEYIRNECFVDGRREPIYSRTGQQISWLVDLRPLLLDAQRLAMASVLLWQRVPDTPFQLACTETAGIPLMVGIQQYAAYRGRFIPGLIVRKERKRSGRLRRVEGRVSGDPIIFVDDIFNSGGSAEDSISALQAMSLEVKGILCVLDFRSDGGLQRAKRLGVTVVSEFGLEEIRPGLRVRHSLPVPNGDLQWKIEWSSIDSWHITPKSTPIVHRGLIYLATTQGDVHALDQTNGREVWRRSIVIGSAKGIWSSPVVFKNHLIFGAYNGNLYSLDCEDGTVRWETQRADYIGSSPLLVRSAGTIIIGLEYDRRSMRGGVASFSAETGECLWEVPCKNYVHATAVLTEDGQTCLIGDNDGNLRSLEVATGKLIWIRSLKGSIKSRPCVQGNTAVVGTFANRCYAVDVNDGRVLWKCSTRGIVYSKPFFQDDCVFITCADRRLYRIDATSGTVIDVHSCKGRIFSSPSKSRLGFLFGTTAGYVYEYDLTTRSLEPRAKVPGRVTNDVLQTEQELMLVCSDATSLYAFRLGVINR